MPAQQFRFHHVGVSVADMDASIAWWERILGFTLERRYMLATIPAEIAMLANGPLHVELLKVPAPKAAAAERHMPDDDLQTCGNKHVAFSVEDVRAFIAEISGRGADVVWLKELPNGRAASFIRDNEGNLIEFVQFPGVDEEVAAIA
jgi:methylmalonyl-CoA/ethylmalonyl-CoA epimerase